MSVFIFRVVFSAGVDNIVSLHIPLGDFLHPHATKLGIFRYKLDDLCPSVEPYTNELFGTTSNINIVELFALRYYL